ncbi:unnamed protein product [Microthlaspi erraticum]|uniref:Uncharacterized protein n=1 Tax=Microthlaspi erraticum TaxID=1685480 RepID=A0A6D2I9L7_9BRAS|nr:unnamed protein product [Microthlaspi erraticum]
MSNRLSIVGEPQAHIRALVKKDNMVDIKSKNIFWSKITHIMRFYSTQQQLNGGDEVTWILSNNNSG